MKKNFWEGYKYMNRIQAAFVSRRVVRLFLRLIGWKEYLAIDEAYYYDYYSETRGIISNKGILYIYKHILRNPQNIV